MAHEEVAYQKAVAQAGKVFNEVVALALKLYSEAVVQAEEDYQRSKPTSPHSNKGGEDGSH